MNDQENADLQSEEQDDSAPTDESFNEQLPTHLARFHHQKLIMIQT